MQAIDGQSLSQQDASAQSAWAGNEAAWVTAHNRAIGFFDDPSTAFDTKNGVRTYLAMGLELMAAGWYPGVGNYSGANISATYQRTSGGAVTPHGTTPSGIDTKHVDPSTNPQVQTDPLNRVTGATGASNLVTWLSATTKSGGAIVNSIPNWVVVGIPAAFLMMRRRR